jgi:L-ribulokinase
VGNVDAHVTAPAAAAVEPGQMVAIMDTSTCHVMSSDQQATVPGMCGVVDGALDWHSGNRPSWSITT